VLAKQVQGPELNPQNFPFPSKKKEDKEEITGPDNNKENTNDQPPFGVHTHHVLC
jgi:hypothetical protein